MTHVYKWGDCIRCGDCCIEWPCGLAKSWTNCEHLIEEENGQYTCPFWPFEGPEFDFFDRVCFAPHQGCGNPGNKRYVKLWNKLKGRDDTELHPIKNENNSKRS